MEHFQDNPSVRLFIDPSTISDKEELNVLDYHVDNTGVLDNTVLLQALHSSGKRIYYPNGIYLFNGDTLDFSGGVRFESREGVHIRNRISDVDIVNFDNQNNLIGLMQNHLEYSERDLGKTAGSLVPPPLAKKPKTKVDIMAYWYNDFGLQAHKTLQCGWIGWHYWSWNHHNAASNPYLKSMIGRDPDPYDPTRHPLLGFYYGDDPVVLDWQSYWLVSHGVNAVCVLAGEPGKWEDPLCRSHWAYQLFNNAKNFKLLKYAIAGPIIIVERGSRSAINYEECDQLLNDYYEIIDGIYAVYQNRYSFWSGGREYPVISLFGENHINGLFDNHSDTKRTLQFYVALAERMRANGFGGVTLFCVFPDERFDAPEVDAYLREKGVIRKKSSYVPWHVRKDWTTCGSYKALVDSYNPPSDPNVILGIGTAVHTHTPHESGWNCPGNSPKLFKEFLEKAIDHLDKNPMMERIITCYNISEWAEGGAGLQPNVHDGFGYLEAVRDSVVTL